MSSYLKNVVKKIPNKYIYGGVGEEKIKLTNGEVYECEWKYGLMKKDTITFFHIILYSII